MVLDLSTESLRKGIVTFLHPVEKVTIKETGNMCLIVVEGHDCRW